MGNLDVRKLMALVEATVLKSSLEKAGAPREVQNFFFCMVKNGCPVQALMNAMEEFHSTVSKEDQKNLHEMLKDLPFDIELEGEENE